MKKVVQVLLPWKENGQRKTNEYETEMIKKDCIVTFYLPVECRLHFRGKKTRISYEYGDVLGERMIKREKYVYIVEFEENEDADSFFSSPKIEIWPKKNISITETLDEINQIAQKYEEKKVNEKKVIKTQDGFFTVI